MFNGNSREGLHTCILVLIALSHVKNASKRDLHAHKDLQTRKQERIGALNGPESRRRLHGNREHNVI